jgi:hypothetical protein
VVVCPELAYIAEKVSFTEVRFGITPQMDDISTIDG